MVPFEKPKIDAAGLAEQKAKLDAKRAAKRAAAAALASAVGVPPLEMDVPRAMAAIAAAEAMGIEVGTAKVDAEAAQTAQQQLATRPNVGGPRSCFWSAVADERMERISGDCGTARAFNLRRALRSLSGLSGEGVQWSGVLARCCLLCKQVMRQLCDEVKPGSAGA